MRKYKDRICNTIAFYDIDRERIDIQGWYEYVNDFFAQYNQVPDRAGVTGEGVPYATKTKTFRYYDKLLKKLNFRGISNIWFASHPPDHGDDYFNVLFMVEFMAAAWQNKGSPTVALGFDDDVLSFDSNLIKELAQDISSFFNAEYGIFYKRHFKSCPGLYAYGGIGGDVYSNEEKLLIGKWNRTYGDPDEYKHGDLRDIYPMNFISKAHLERQVEATLQEWIESSPEHGTLSKLTDTLWTWEVPEEKIPEVREALRHTGIVLCI